MFNRTITLRSLREDLHRRFAHLVDAAVIDDVLDSVAKEHDAAAVRDFVVVLIEREAVDRLGRLALAPQATMPLADAA